MRPESDRLDQIERRLDALHQVITDAMLRHLDDSKAPNPIILDQCVCLACRLFRAWGPEKLNL